MQAHFLDKSFQLPFRFFSTAALSWYLPKPWYRCWYIYTSKFIKIQSHNYHTVL